MRLEGRVAVVTGGGGFFGKAISSRLAEEGARIATWDNDASAANALLTDLGAPAGSAIAVDVDVSDGDAVSRAAHETKERLGIVDVLVNNAAYAKPALAWELTSEHWQRTLDVNLTGAFNCVRALLPDMMARRRGKIINIGSVAALQGRPFTSPAYAASKGGLLGLTVSLARHLAEFGITVNAINPGIFPHEAHRAFSSKELDQLVSDIPLNRGGVVGARGQPEDIASAVLFFASGESDYVTGAFLNVNGGSRMG